MTPYPWRRDWLAWFLGGMAVLGVLSTLYVYSLIGMPYGGYLDELAVYRDNYVRVGEFTPTWWPNAQLDHLRSSVLLLIDGLPYRTNSLRMYAAAQAAGRPAVTLTLAGPNGFSSLSVPVRVFSWSDFLDLKLPANILGVNWWLLAVLIYVTRPRESLNRTVAWSFAFPAVVAWAGTGVVFVGPWPERLTNFVYLLFLWPLTGAALFHLALVFPFPSRWLTRRVLLGIYGAAAVTGLAWGGAALMDTFWGWSSLAASLDQYGGFMAQTGLFSGGIVAVLVRLVWVWATSREQPLVRRQTQIVFWGMLFAGPFFVLIINQGLRMPGSLFWEDLDTRYLLLAVPLAFAFSILRYKSFQSSPPLAVGVALTAFSALLASLSSWAMARVGDRAVVPLSDHFFPVFLAVLVASGFWSRQTSWQGWLSRVFSWERRSYAAVRLFGQRLAGAVEWMVLPDQIARGLVQALRVEQAAVWAWNALSGEFELAGRSGFWPLPLPLILRPGGPLTSGEPLYLAASQPASWLEPARAAGVDVIAPLLTPAGPVGLLGLGKQWDEEIFDARDLEIIALVAQQASLMLLTALQLKELRRMPGQLAEAQRGERQRVAQDLHDTVQQRLGALQLILETVQLRLSQDPARAPELLEQAMNEVETVAQMVSRIRLNLDPPDLARGLADAVRRLVERYRHASGLLIELDLPQDLDQYVPAKTQQELYRVLQQALDNIVEHARATRVQIWFAVWERRLLFTVRDDGVGLTEAQIEHARAGASYGLISMEARLSSLGGGFQIGPSAHSGTRVDGWVPLAKPVGSNGV